MEEASNVLFRIGPLEVTSAVTTMWAIILVLTVLSWLATRCLKEVPGPLQSAAEIAVGKLRDYYEGLLGKRKARKYFPVFATFFIYIIVCNYSGLLPGAGHVKGFALPTASLSVTAGLATVAFFTTHVIGIRPAAVSLLSDAAAESDRAVRSPRLACAATLRQHVRRGDRDGKAV